MCKYLKGGVGGPGSESMVRFRQALPLIWPLTSAERAWCAGTISGYIETRCAGFSLMDIYISHSLLVVFE